MAFSRELEPEEYEPTPARLRIDSVLACVASSQSRSRPPTTPPPEMYPSDRYCSIVAETRVQKVREKLVTTAKQ